MSSILEFPTTPSSTAGVDALECALDDVASLVVSGLLETLSAPDLLAVTARLQGVASRAQALAVSAAAEVHVTASVASDGFTTTTRWLEATARMSQGESRACLGIGERLREEFGATRDAWLAGEISTGAVREITTSIPRRLKGLPAEDYVAARTELEAMALHHARSRTVAEVRRAIERAAIVVDPAGADAAVLAAKESEYLRSHPCPTASRSEASSRPRRQRWC